MLNALVPELLLCHIILNCQVALRQRTEDTPEHHEKILEEDIEESRALQGRLDRANQLREAAERKVASLARRLAQVQAEASVAALEAERAEVWYNQKQAFFPGPRKGEGVTFALDADRVEAHNTYRHIGVVFFVREAGAGGEAGGEVSPL